MFIEEPVSQNVSEGGQATFNCTAASLIQKQHWVVHQQAIKHSSNSNRGLKEYDYIDDSAGLKKYVLTVPATEINTGIFIQCVIFLSIFENGMKSKGATLQIQGFICVFC